MYLTHRLDMRGSAGFLELVDGGAPLPPPAKLSAPDANEADALEHVHGEYVARALFSRAWQHRQAALRFIARDAATGGESATDMRALGKYVVRGLKDQVTAVVADAAAIVRQTVDAGGRPAAALLAAGLPALVERLGDGNARTAVRLLPCIAEPRFLACPPLISTVCYVHRRQ